MNKIPSSVAIGATLLALTAFPGSAAAQSFETLGTRAAGMGGAFVAVADDASAVYWNPAGLATSGRLFNVSIDFSQGHADLSTTAAQTEGDRTGGLLALATPPLGLSYYRLTTARVRPTTSNGVLRANLSNLVTHNAGITLVQSIVGRVAVGSTLRYVHGQVASGLSSFTTDELLDEARDLASNGRNTYDLDIGAMAMLGTIRAGVTVRNLREPEFTSPTNEVFAIKRQSRAGIAYVGVPGLIVSGDVDLERNDGSLGEERNVAVGAEAHLFPRFFARGGFRINTLDTSIAGPEAGQRAKVYSLGASVLTIKSLIVDAQVTLGSKAGDRGWGIAGRMVY